MVQATEAIRPEDVKDHLRVVDITDDVAWMAAARWEIAAAYSKLTNPKRKVRMHDIYGSLCEDGYEDPVRSRTIALAFEPPSARGEEFAGLVRIVFGRKQIGEADLPPIDAMHIVEPHGDWPYGGRGVQDDQIGELGRFTIIEDSRTPAMRAAGVDRPITFQHDLAKRLVGLEPGGCATASLLGQTLGTIGNVVSGVIAVAVAFAKDARAVARQHFGGERHAGGRRRNVSDKLPPRRVS
jgi:hypothetical protein